VKTDSTASPFVPPVAREKSRPAIEEVLAKKAEVDLASPRRMPNLEELEAIAWTQ
jgi:hypothetical protein